MTVFHGGADALWNAIHAKTKGPKQIVAAIAYLTDTSAIPFKRGDLVVADLSKRAVASGVSCARVAELLRDAGVQLYVMEGLHSKVLVVGGQVLFSGSMNASHSSQNCLIEAGIETSDESQVSRALAWLRKLIEASKPLTPSLLNELLAIKPKRQFQLRVRKIEVPETPSVTKRRPQFFLLQTQYNGLPNCRDSDHDKIIKAAQHEARFKDFSLDCYEEYAHLARPIREQDFILNVDREARNRTVVWPPEVVWKVDRDRRGWGIHVSRPKRRRRNKISWQEFIELAKEVGVASKVRRRPNRLPLDFGQLLLKEWPG